MSIEGGSKIDGFRARKYTTHHRVSVSVVVGEHVRECGAVERHGTVILSAGQPRAYFPPSDARPSPFRTSESGCRRSKNRSGVVRRNHQDFRPVGEGVATEAGGTEAGVASVGWAIYRSVRYRPGRPPSSGRISREGEASCDVSISVP
jgi:hypothetical protein